MLTRTLLFFPHLLWFFESTPPFGFFNMCGTFSGVKPWKNLLRPFFVCRPPRGKMFGPSPLPPWWIPPRDPRMDHPRVSRPSFAVAGRSSPFSFPPPGSKERISLDFFFFALWRNHHRSPPRFPPSRRPMLSRTGALPQFALLLGKSPLFFPPLPFPGASSS